MSASAQDAGGRPVRIPLRPALVLGVAFVVVLVAGVTVVARLPWIVGALVMVAAVGVTVWATLSAVVRRSLVVAPLAICLLAVGNPAVLTGLGSYVERNAGVITFSFDRGVVLWASYPGISGWDAPDDPQTVDTPRLAQTVQRALRTAVGVMSDEYAWAWQIGEGEVGIRPIANGFGGDSMFQRVDAPLWTTTDFDGSDGQRASLVAAVAASAAELGLTDVVDASGDVGTGDGTRRWIADAQALTLTVDGAHVALGYSGGPFLAPTILPGEFERAREAYEGLTPPPTIVTPDLP